MTSIAETEEQSSFGCKTNRTNRKPPLRVIQLKMELQDFAPIFGKPTRVEWVNRGSLSLLQFLFHVYSPNPSHLRFLVTDFHSNTWESTKSAFQLEDMVGIFDFSLYVVSLLHPSSLISINMLFLLLFFLLANDEMGLFFRICWCEKLYYFM